MISVGRIGEILWDCAFTLEEMPSADAPVPEGAILVEGIVAKFGFHPGRLESHRAEVAAMLGQLPREFHCARDGGGGGWSFLNGCTMHDGEMWTGSHQCVEGLLVLGIGLGMAWFLMPRDLWSMFPGGMPYFVVDTHGIANPGWTKGKLRQVEATVDVPGEAGP